MLLVSFPLAGLVIASIKETTYEVEKVVYLSDLKADAIEHGTAEKDPREDIEEKE
jgi:hypothetical protein